MNRKLYYHNSQSIASILDRNTNIFICFYL